MYNRDLFSYLPVIILDDFLGDFTVQFQFQFIIPLSVERYFLLYIQ